MDLSNWMHAFAAQLEEEFAFLKDMGADGPYNLFLSLEEDFYVLLSHGKNELRLTEPDRWTGHSVLSTTPPEGDWEPDELVRTLIGAVEEVLDPDLPLFLHLADMPFVILDLQSGEPVDLEKAWHSGEGAPAHLGRPEDYYAQVMAAHFYRIQDAGAYAFATWDHYLRCVPTETGGIIIKWHVSHALEARIEVYERLDLVPPQDMDIQGLDSLGQIGDELVAGTWRLSSPELFPKGDLRQLLTRMYRRWLLDLSRQYLFAFNVYLNQEGTGVFLHTDSGESVAQATWMPAAFSIRTKQDAGIVNFLNALSHVRGIPGFLYKTPPLFGKDPGHYFEFMVSLGLFKAMMDYDLEVPYFDHHHRFPQALRGPDVPTRYSAQLQQLTPEEFYAVLLDMVSCNGSAYTALEGTEYPGFPVEKGKVLVDNLISEIFGRTAPPEKGFYYLVPADFHVSDEEHPDHFSLFSGEGSDVCLFFGWRDDTYVLTHTSLS